MTATNIQEVNKEAKSHAVYPRKNIWFSMRKNWRESGTALQWPWWEWTLLHGKYWAEGCLSLKSQAGFSSSSTLYSYWTEWIIFLFKLIPQELYGGVLGTLHSTKTILRYQVVFEWSWMRFMGPVSPNCYQVNAVPRYTGLCLSSRGWSELNVSMRWLICNVG